MEVSHIFAGLAFQQLHDRQLSPELKKPKIKKKAAVSLS